MNVVKATSFNQMLTRILLIKLDFAVIRKSYTQNL